MFLEEVRVGAGENLAVLAKAYGHKVDAVRDIWSNPANAALAARGDSFYFTADEIKAEVQDAWDFADRSPEPPLEALYEDVYVDTTSDAESETAVAAD